MSKLGTNKIRFRGVRLHILDVRIMTSRAEPIYLSQQHVSAARGMRLLEGARKTLGT